MLRNAWPSFDACTTSPNETSVPSSVHVELKKRGATDYIGKND